MSVRQRNGKWVVDFYPEGRKRTNHKPKSATFNICPQSPLRQP